MAHRMMRALLACLLLLSITAQAETADFKPFVQGSAKALIEARAGKPFILALWSVECAELAQLAALSQRYPKLDVVLVATDNLDARKEAEAILAQYSLSRAERWIFADDFVERLRFEIDPRWHGELPRTYLHGPGKAVAAITGTLEPQRVAQWLESVAP
jgi:hypothetical protein